MSDEMKVVKLAEVEGLLKEEREAINKDIVDLKDQMDADRDATKLALDERADDVAKYGEAIEKITEANDALAEKINKLEKEREYGSTSKELREAIEPISKGALQEPASADGDFRKTVNDGKATLKQLVEGVVLEDGQFYSPKHEAIKQLQEDADALILMDAELRYGPEGDQYKRQGGMRSLKLWDRFQRNAETVSKATTEAIDTTDLANWMPTAFSPATWEKIVIGLPEVSVFDEFTMTAPTVQLHAEVSDTEADIVAEATTIASLNPFSDTNVQNLEPGKITFSAVKLRSRYVTTREAEEDSIVPLLPRLQRKMIRNMREALADGIINGQETTKIDTGGTHFGKANTSFVAADVRGSMDGLRYFAWAPTTDHKVDGGNAATSLSLMRSSRKFMGEIGTFLPDLVWFLNVKGYMDLLSDTNLATADKLGGPATNRTGAIGVVDGVDLLLSRRMPENSNASGVIDGTTTDRGLHILVHTGAFLLGNRRRMTVGQDLYGAKDGRDLFLFWRGDFQKMYPLISSESEITEVVLYNTTT